MITVSGKSYEDKQIIHKKCIVSRLGSNTCPLYRKCGRLKLEYLESKATETRVYNSSIKN